MNNMSVWKYRPIIDKVVDENVKLIHTFEGHRDYVRTVLFFPRLEILVSGGDDHVLRFWNTLSNSCVKEVVCHKDYIRQLIKWDDESLLSASDEGNVLEISVTKMSRTKELFCKRNFRIIHIAKANDDHVLAVEHSKDQILIISYSKCCLVRAIPDFHVHFYSEILLSKRFENCFYINCSKADDHVVRLVSLSDSNKIRKFGNDRVSLETNTMSSYKDKSNHEILVVSGDNKLIWFYDTELRDQENGTLIKQIDTKHDIQASVVVNNRYLLTGMYESGSILIYDLQNDFGVVNHFGAHDHTIFGLDTHICGTRDLLVFSGSRDQLVCVSKVTGLCLMTDDDDARADLMERVSYLREEMERRDESFKEFLIEIGFVQSTSIFKSFFLL